MSGMRFARIIPVVAFGLGLAALPLAVSMDGLSDQPAFAKDGGKGGGGKGGGGKGGGKGNGKGNGGGSSSKGSSGTSGKSAATDVSHGKALGHEKKRDAVGPAAATVSETDVAVEAEVATTPHPSKLGRLNAFMNASPKALANAAPNSAIGVVANAYREALAAYGGATGEAPAGDVPAVDPALDAAARALAAAANKELTADVVATVNAQLAETFSDDPALAGYADPTAPESQAVAEAIAALAEGYQAEETSQGLGDGMDDNAEDGGDTDEGAGDTVTDGTATEGTVVAAQ